MRNKAMLIAAVLLGGCTTTQARSDTLAGVCDAAKAQSAVGQPFTVELGADLESRSGSRTSRVIRPGQAVTMDYRPDRLNIELDSSDKIVSIRCG